MSQIHVKPISITFDNNCVPVNNLTFKKMIKDRTMQLYLTQTLLVESLNSPTPANRLEFLLKFGYKKILSTGIECSLMEILGKKIDPGFLRGKGQYELLKKIKKVVRNNQPIEHTSSKFKEDILLQNIMKEIESEGSKIITRYKKATKASFPHPTVETFIDELPNYDTIIWKIIQNTINKSVAIQTLYPNCKKKLEIARLNYQRHKYLYLEYRVIGYSLFALIFKSILKNSIDKSVVPDSQYLPCLYHVDYLVSNDKYLKEAAEFVFYGESVGKVITLDEFNNLITRL